MTHQKVLIPIQVGLQIRVVAESIFGMFTCSVYAYWIGGLKFWVTEIKTSSTSAIAPLSR